MGDQALVVHLTDGCPRKLADARSADLRAHKSMRWPGERKHWPRFAKRVLGFDQGGRATTRTVRQESEGLALTFKSHI